MKAVGATSLLLRVPQLKKKTCFTETVATKTNENETVMPEIVG